MTNSLPDMRPPETRKAGSAGPGTGWVPHDVGLTIRPPRSPGRPAPARPRPPPVRGSVGGRGEPGGSGPPAGRGDDGATRFCGPRDTSFGRRGNGKGLVHATRPGTVLPPHEGGRGELENDLTPGERRKRAFQWAAPLGTFLVER